MAFPTSPTTGDIYNGYVYINGAWSHLVSAESGSNSKGQWLRLIDGTQICYGMIPVAGADVSVRTASDTYPMPFISAPVVTATMQDSQDGGDGKWSAEVVSKTATSVTVSLYYIAGNYSGTYDVGYIAVGRYK